MPWFLKDQNVRAVSFGFPELPHPLHFCLNINYFSSVFNVLVCLKFKIGLNGETKTVLRSGRLIDSRRQCVLACESKNFIYIITRKHRSNSMKWFEMICCCPDDFSLSDGSVDNTLNGFELTPVEDSDGEHYLSLESISNQLMAMVHHYYIFFVTRY